MISERSLTRGGVLLIALVMISACGQKGPLRLPEPEPESESAPAAPNDSRDPSTLEARRRNPHE